MHLYCPCPRHQHSEQQPVTHRQFGVDEFLQQYTQRTFCKMDPSASPCRVQKSPDSNANGVGALKMHSLTISVGENKLTDVVVCCWQYSQTRSTPSSTHVCRRLKSVVAALASATRRQQSFVMCLDGTSSSLSTRSVGTKQLCSYSTLLSDHNK